VVLTQGSSEDEAEEQEQRYVHMFNKAIFDLANEAAPLLLPHCPHSAIDEVLRWLFELAPRMERAEAEDEDEEWLLRMGEELFDGLLEEALWDFLECF
jgi:hypothetical protein